MLNAAVESLAEQVNLSSKELPPGESEVELTGLSLLPSRKVRPPRLAESPVHLECRVLQIVPIGNGPIAANLVIGEVVVIHVDDGVLDESGPRRPAETADDRPAGRRSLLPEHRPLRDGEAPVIGHPWASPDHRTTPGG